MEDFRSRIDAALSDDPYYAVSVPLSAREVVDYAHVLRADLPPGVALYRGIGDAQHGLVPSALRGVNRDQMLEFLSDVVSFRDAGSALEDHREWAEFSAISNFYVRASAIGQRLPRTSYETHEALQKNQCYGARSTFEAIAYQDDTSLVGGRPWPGPELWPLIALAQHSGVPTRFLDWSSDPYVALYFAAAAVVGRLFRAKSDQELVELLDVDFGLWMLLRRPVEESRTLRGGGGRPVGEAPADRSTGDTIHIFEPLHVENSYLRAQQTVFTLVTNEHSRDYNDNRSLERVFADLFRGAENTSLGQAAKAHVFSYRRPSNCAVFQRLTIGSAEAPAVMALLESLGYDAATLCPGYRGCERAVRESKRVASVLRRLRALDAQ